MCPPASLYLTGSEGPELQLCSIEDFSTEVSALPIMPMNLESHGLTGAIIGSETYKWASDGWLIYPHEQYKCNRCFLERDPTTYSPQYPSIDLLNNLRTTVILNSIYIPPVKVTTSTSFLQLLEERYSLAA